MFLIFGFNTYYPEGGWADFREKAETPEEAKTAAEALLESGEWSWIQVVDTDTMSLVQDWSRTF